MSNVILKGGRVSEGTSSRLNVEIPSGMSGKQLAAWKKKNESAICAAIEANELPASIEAESGEGDISGRG